MKLAFKIFLLILIYPGFVNSQNLSKSDQQFVDSLKLIKDYTVFVFLEYNKSSRTGIIEEKLGQLDKGCSYNTEYWIFWIKNGDNIINSKTSNNCYSIQPEGYTDTALINDSDLLFTRLFFNPGTLDTILYNTSLDFKERDPIGIFYTLTKYIGDKEYQIGFDNDFFFMINKNEDPTSIQYLLNIIFVKFKIEKKHLYKEGVKNDSKWQ